MLTAIPCTAMRGGTSKGLFFLARNLPADTAQRDAALLSAMGSPDDRQIDGMGGAHPLTSKVAVVGPSSRDDADVDYLFLQVVVDKAEVSDSQNCGNMLAGVGPFAIEEGLVAVTGDVTPVRIHMVNTGAIAKAYVSTPNGAVEYEGDARIDGVPGTSAVIPIDFLDVAGSSCGALLPTGNASDEIDGVRATLIDNGMPCAIMAAGDLGVRGDETRDALDANTALKTRLEKIRLAAGPLMNLGEVAEKSVPKMILVSAPVQGGAVSTRSFIPHRCHASIGVFAAVSVASACLIEGSPAAAVAVIPQGARVRVSVEHPSGETTCVVTRNEAGGIGSTAILRTARKLFDGVVF